MTKVSSRYLGSKGLQYFGAAGRFDGKQDPGRRWQARYFRPFCTPENVVLDFGCGDGTILRSVNARRRLGVEINPHCIEKIRTMNCQLNVPLEVRSRVDDWDDGIVDVAISNHALEHVIEPFDMLRTLLFKLRPGGRFILVTPYDDWRASGSRNFGPGDAQNHLYTWSPRNISNLLREAGFEVESSRLVRSAWSPKIFWINRVLGARAFAAACLILSILLKRCEVLTICRRPP